MIRDMKASPDMIEGPEAFKRFDALMGSVVKVPHAVIQQRIEEHKKQAAKNPNKRGPKPQKRRALS
jgi:hypothetical protein